MLRQALLKLARTNPELRSHLVPLLRQGSVAKPLMWSVDWRTLWDRIQATYDITQEGSAWYIRDINMGRSYGPASRAQVVEQALGWFMSNLKMVAK